MFSATTSPARLPVSLTQPMKKTFRTSVHESGLASEVCVSSTAEKSSSSDRQFQLSLLVDDKPAACVYFMKGFYHRAMSQEADDLGPDLAVLVKIVPVHYWARKNGTPMSSKHVTAISYVLEEGFFTETLLFCLYRTAPLVSCCCALAQDCELDSMHDTALADSTRGIQQHRLLGYIEFRQASPFAAPAAGQLASRDPYTASLASGAICPNKASNLP